MTAKRVLPWDWYAGEVPDNVFIDETAFVETAFSFYLYRSRLPTGVHIGKGASTYLGTMFDVGPRGRVTLGDYALVHGARIICDTEVEIGDYALISWNVVLMDTYRASLDMARRRQQLEDAATRSPRSIESREPGRPVRIARNVWIGFDACVLPGVNIGEGAIVGARSVVTDNVPPRCIVAGNPARIVRRLGD
jgi:acetyltransferase-like isoleucine patch superfamily enzyme